VKALPTPIAHRGSIVPRTLIALLLAGAVALPGPARSLAGADIATVSPTGGSPLTILRLTVRADVVQRRRITPTTLVFRSRPYGAYVQVRTPIARTGPTTFTVPVPGLICGSYAADGARWTLLLLGRDRTGATVSLGEFGTFTTICGMLPGTRASNRVRISPIGGPVGTIITLRSRGPLPFARDFGTTASTVTFYIGIGGGYATVTAPAAPVNATTYQVRAPRELCMASAFGTITWGVVLNDPGKTGYARADHGFTIANCTKAPGGGGGGGGGPGGRGGGKKPAPPATATDTPVDTDTPTATATETATETETATATATPTAMATATATRTPTATTRPCTGASACQPASPTATPTAAGPAPCTASSSCRPAVPTATSTQQSAPSQPVVSLNPAALDFGTQPVGAMTSWQAVTLANEGTMPLTISGIIVQNTGQPAPPAFILQHQACGSVLAPGTRCQILVAFRPPAPGEYSVALTVLDNGPGGAQQITLSGVGRPL
jgi:hypothetical protein